MRGDDECKVEGNAAKVPVYEGNEGGRQRVENAGWNDVGGVAGSSGAYIDFGPRTG